MSKRYYLCPVCGFDKLKDPPYGELSEPSYEVCPCCGFEFGFDAVNKQTAFADFRRRWVKNGCCWFRQSSKPKNWDLKRQLRSLNDDPPR